MVSTGEDKDNGGGGKDESSYYFKNKDPTHLAKLTRAFCPPLRAVPCSPTRLKSPFGSSLRSCSRAHTDGEKSLIVSAHYLSQNLIGNYFQVRFSEGRC
ncbi:hypothetical protein E2C01_035957 [Portunus trituberculatus]|uniref:Uncharacterized protein n=1 Tax=Portunus trituberculatus TaxID=210409 RepID=A0A5B7F9V9_PORTR|nr:hypothetical protein [Portunus trituberculatus]